jgi:hypothetical protein
MENKIYFFPDEKKFSQPKEPKGLSKPKGPTGELVVMKEVYLERKGVCQVTGQKIEFHPKNCLHVLSKGAYPRFRLYKKNIVLAIDDVHDLYDNSSREFLLSKYPKAKLIYDLKDELRIEYYQKQPTI